MLNKKAFFFILFLTFWALAKEEIFQNDYLKWEVIAGDWKVGEGKYSIKEIYGRASYSLAPTPITNRQIIEVNIKIKQRSNKIGWAAAGICLWWDEGSFWRLSLVEAPDFYFRYPELIETFEGRHQAQMQGETRLPFWTGGQIDWQYNRLYKMILELNEDGLRGEIKDLQTGDSWWIRYSFEKAPAVREGVAGLWAQGMEVEFSDFSLRYWTREYKSEHWKIERGEKGNIAIFAEQDFPGDGNKVAEYLVPYLRRKGFGVTFLDSRDLSDQSKLNPANFFLLVIPDARYFPVESSTSLRSFLRRGGNLLLIGAPAFTKMLWKWQGEWLDRQEISERINQYLLPQQKDVFINFENEDLSKWGRESNSPKNPVDLELVPGKEGKCLKFKASLPGWAAAGSPIFSESPFKPVETLTCFWAKGDETTTKMSVEWRERDGSRWIAVVDLTTQWKFYALPPQAFLYWKDNPSLGRGFPGDCFNPQNAQQILFGISDSHTPQIGGGEHTFWVDEVATQKVPSEIEALPSPASLRPINLETVSPSYKIYPLSNIQEFRTSQQAVFLPPLRTKEKIQGFSPVWRPQGRGYNRDRIWRWIPLLDAFNEGENRGSIASILLRRDGGSLISFQLQNPLDIKREILSQILFKVIERFQGAFLFEAGAKHFLYYPKEDVELGAKIHNLGKLSRNLRAVCEIISDNRKVFQEEKRFTLSPEGKTVLQWRWKCPSTSRNYQDQIELWEGEEIIDRISHPLSVVATAKAPKKEDFVQVKGSDFYLKGKKWYPRGINYWPSMLGGLDADIYAGNWLSPTLYDPVLIERDLSILEKLGINMLAAIGADISLISREERVVRNLFDFLYRADKHGMKVMLYIPANPFNFDEEVIRSLSKGGGIGEVGLAVHSQAEVFRFIKETGLPNITTIFAYDIAWEPAEVLRIQAGAFNSSWEKWLVERYGSVENAEADFGIKLPRKDGKVAPPIGLNNRKADAAFLRFFSDLASKKYGAVVRAIKALDPNHLVSFRGGACGVPQAYWGAHLYSVGVAKHIDFLCPEGYNLQTKGYGNPTPWEDIRKGGLITLYYRFISREKPVVWMEFCGPIWPNGTEWRDEMLWTPKERLEYQKEEEEKFYRMFVESGAKGCAPWWYPGGFRVGEMSDAGIINPDWTLRPVAEVIKRYNPLFVSRKPQKPNAFITIDLDAHPLDAWDYYAPIYLKLVQGGKTPYLKTDGTGTNSLNTPLVAVGNVPYNGRNPLKYLNAEFNYIEIKDKKGGWRRVEDGDIIEVDGGGEIWCKASIGNIGEAEWIAPKKSSKEGTVYLHCYGEDFEQDIGIPDDVAFLKDAQIPPFQLFKELSKPTQVSFVMTAKGRAFFGERITITLIPK
ncbi:hypothetical protein H5T87_10015 [bacterium]|nr:hypothetical protein [bacterium]